MEAAVDESEQRTFLSATSLSLSHLVPDIPDLKMREDLPCVYVALMIRVVFFGHLERSKVLVENETHDIAQLS